MRTLIALLMLSSSVARAADYANEWGQFFVDPHVAVGANVNQGTTFLLGLDVGYLIDTNWSAGVGAFAAIGTKGTRDRDLGLGPFVRWAYPLADFLIFSAREDLDYVDEHRPTPEGYDVATGVASFTTVALHVKIAQIFGVTGGYRMAFPLNNSDLTDGRSMPFLGFAIGI